jgi:hypothetical protein
MIVYNNNPLMNKYLKAALVTVNNDTNSKTLNLNDSETVHSSRLILTNTVCQKKEHSVND